MQNIKELARHRSPGGRPQPLAFVGKTLWVGCWDTDRVYCIDPATWSVTEEFAAPGRPFGLAAVEGELRAVVSIGADDDRYLYRLVPGQGFDEGSKTPCPDLTGSHLAWSAGTLYLTQMHYRRIVTLDANAAISREVALPTRCAGIGFGAGNFYIISADEEFEELKLATLDLHQSTPPAVPLAAIASGARGLAFDGTNWWTSDREAGEYFSFRL